MALFILIEAALICIVSCFLWKFFRNSIVKSPLHDIPGPPPVSFLSGNLSQFFSPDGIPWHLSMAKTYGRAFKFYGLMGDEQLYVTDPRALHHIVVKDQYVYEETSMFLAGNKMLFGDGLISTLGDRHKKQRRMLNPVFSPAHMRNLVPIFNSVSHRVRDALAKKVTSEPKEIELMQWLSRTALELIGQAGLGYSFENFETDAPTSEYSSAVKDLFPALFGVAILRQFAPYALWLGPGWLRERLLHLIPSPNLRRVKRIGDIMHKTSVEVFNAKKQALNQGDETVTRQVGEGKDIMSVLLRANAVATEEDRLPEAELLGQMNTLVFAAHDTTSNALARLLHLLALNPEVQSKLRAEVTKGRLKGDLDYDDLMGLPYMDAVVRETMRLYAPITSQTRTTRKDIILPLGAPIKSADGTKDIHEIYLKNNTNVVIGTATANRDPAVWGEDAEEWKPERWLDHKLDDITKERLPGIFSGMMTFLGGGRACIGFKFSQLEMKVVLSMLLETFIFDLPDNDIVWRNSIVATPSTKGREKETPHLPMKVSLVRPKYI